MPSRQPKVLIIQLPRTEADFLKTLLTDMIEASDPSSEDVLIAGQILSKVTEELNWVFSYKKDGD